MFFIDSFLVLFFQKTNLRFHKVFSSDWLLQNFGLLEVEGQICRHYQRFYGFNEFEKFFRYMTLSLL